jgi:FkbM family methyltransferase
MIESTDVITAYRLILGRVPESDATIAYRTQEPSIESLGAKLLASDEFRRRVVYGMLEGAPSQWVCAEIRHGLKLWIDLLDVGVAAGVLQDNWEPDETGFILSVLRPGDTFIDIGANVGWFTVLAAKAVGPTGHVHAFEPRADIKTRLAASVEANGFAERCTVHACALGAAPGEMMLAAIPSERNPGHSFLVPGVLPEGAVTIDQVPVRRLDSFTFDRPVRLIKLDVEGAEALVVSGAGALLEHDHPVIVSEVFPRWLRAVSGVEPRDYLDLLKSHGYRVFHLSSLGVGQEIHSFPRDSTMGDEVYFNILALAEADVERLLLRPLDDRVASLERALKEAEKGARRDVQTIRGELEHTQAQAHALAQAKAKLEAAEAGARRDVQTIRGELEHALAQAKAELEAAREAADQLIVNLRAQLEEEQQTLKGLRSELSAWTRRALAVENSTFWRATGPLRRLSDWLPSAVRANLARAARLVWWTVSLQLRTRLRERAVRIAQDRATRAAPEGPAAEPEPEAPSRRNGPFPEPLVAVSQPIRPLLVSAHSPLPLHEADRPVVMIIDDRWPEPDRDGGSIDAVNLIKAMLVLGFDVIFTAASDYAGTGWYRDAVAALGARCLGPSDSPSVQAFIEAHGCMVSLYVLTRYAAGGQYLELIRHNWPKAKIVFNTVDLHFLREEREARLLDDPQRLRSAANTRDREEFLVHRSDATIVVSPVERKLLMGAVPGAYVVELPLARAEQPPRSGFAERYNIGFIGSFDHMPNVDAVRYFLGDIWPLIRQRLPGCRFSIVGSKLPAAVLQDAPDDVEYLGHIPDVAPWFDRLRLSVAPLRYGAGMKGKVVSSLAAGVPCVGTPIAVEGMALTADRDILVAETPKAFADAVTSVYQDNALWARLSMAGQSYVARENSIGAHTRCLHEMLITLGLPCITPP